MDIALAGRGNLAASRASQCDFAPVFGGTPVAMVIGRQ
jgi:hypothetical protein